MKSKFNVKKYIENTCKRLKSIASEEVLVSVSGGVDSTTCATLLKKVGVRSKLLLIDTGFMRMGEPIKVKNMFKKLGSKLILLDKKQYFYSIAKQKNDPVEKRDGFRKVYFESITNYMKINNIKYIVQGTQLWNSKSKIYHNRPTDGFNKNGFQVIEPLKQLSKNQIRQIAKRIDLPQEIIDRKPFPGPGLLIRFGGKYTSEKLFLIKKATNIIDEIVNKYKKDFKNCYQIFPYLCDGSSVTFVNKNEQGDLGYILLIRAIKQIIKKNNIEYHPFKIPQNIETEMIKKLMNINKVARICFDATPKKGTGFGIKHGATIEYI